MGVGRCHREVRSCGRRPLPEQPDGVAGRDVLEAVVDGGRRQWPDGEDVLPWDVQRLSARDQDPEARGRGQQGPDERRTRVREVFAVVQQQQRVVPGQRSGHRLHQPGSRAAADAESLGHRLPDEFRGGQRC
jgi:hypothetical protein